MLERMCAWCLLYNSVRWFFRNNQFSLVKTQLKVFLIIIPKTTNILIILKICTLDRHYNIKYISAYSVFLMLMFCCIYSLIFIRPEVLYFIPNIFILCSPLSLPLSEFLNFSISTDEESSPMRLNYSHSLLFSPYQWQGQWWTGTKMVGIVSLNTALMPDTNHALR